MILIPKTPNSDEWFTCEYCEGTFKKAWTDEEAAAELDQRFDGFRPEECSTVCDTCYKAFMEWFNANTEA